MNSRPTILLADDDATLRRALSIRLKSAGFEVVTAENGAQAMTVIDEQPIDAAVLDVQMPGVDGFGVCEHIRSHSERSEIPICLLTGASDGILHTHFGRLTETVHGNHYVTKPVDGVVLATLLRQCLEHENASCSPALA